MEIQKNTPSDIQRMVEDSVKTIVNETIDMDREIRLAYTELQQMGKHLSSLGLRLEDTKYRLLFLDLKDDMIALNNALIKAIKGEKR